MPHWGSYIWNVFHTLSYSFLSNEKYRYEPIIRNTANILPCQMCSGHFKSMLALYDTKYQASDKKRLISWLIIMHNTVNKRLGKKTYMPKEVEKFYFKNGKLIVNHKKFVEFIKIVKRYCSRGRSPIVVGVSSNILVNLCHVFPCNKCREELKKYVTKHKLTINNTNRWVNDIIGIISKDIPNKIIIRKRVY